MNESVPPIKVHHHNQYLISFFAGREPGKRHAEERNWVDDSAIKLGTAMYAIHRGAEAIVYDTFTSVPHAEFVRFYLEKMGIRKFTVVLSHWHLDHIAGNAVFDDFAIIATSLTRDALVRYKADIEAGKVWGPPSIAPLVFPNIMFDDHLEIRVGDIDLDLRRMNIHSIDGCVIYLPKDRLLLAGDTLEDPLTLHDRGGEPRRSRQKPQGNAELGCHQDPSTSRWPKAGSFPSNPTARYTIKISSSCTTTGKTRRCRSTLAARS